MKIFPVSPKTAYKKALKNLECNVKDQIKTIKTMKVDSTLEERAILDIYIRADKIAYELKQKFEAEQANKKNFFKRLFGK